MADPDRPLAVLDIDGVLADVRHRLGYLERRPKDWTAFFEAAALDPPLKEGIALASALGQDHALVYLTGRPERLRRVTLAWLTDHGLPPGPLHMRRDGDHRPARVIKLAALRELSARGLVSVIIDDDPLVIAAMQGAGWPGQLADWVPRAGSLQVAQEGEGRS